MPNASVCLLRRERCRAGMIVKVPAKRPGMVVAPIRDYLLAGTPGAICAEE
jgi:hypothetical protein